MYTDGSVRKWIQRSEIGGKVNSEKKKYTKTREREIRLIKRKVRKRERGKKKRGKRMGRQCGGIRQEWREKSMEKK